MEPIPAIYFDGLSALPRPVVIYTQGDRLIVDGDSVARDEPLAGVAISEPLGAAPRVLQFSDGARCEVREHAAFAAMLHEAGIGDGLVVRLQARWHWALAAVVLTVAAALAGYHWGLPAAADWIAARLPERLLAGMAESTLAILDEHVFETSTLPAERQTRLVADFDRLRPPAGTAPAHRIVFRDGGAIGANAFALPDGTLVVTDQLVEIAEDDREILAVLTHELGHLERRHSLRMVIQGSIVGVLVGWYLGDVSNVAAGLPSALLQARYSRDFEREADDYAQQMLAANGLPPAALADILGRMQAETDCARIGNRDPFHGYLSSHPATGERILRLGGTQRQDDCPASTSREASDDSGEENAYLTAFLDIHGWHCEQHYADRATLAQALEGDPRLNASTEYDGVYETGRLGVSYAVSPEDYGCTTDVLLRPEGHDTALFTLNGIRSRLLERGYLDTGRETESTTEGLDGTEVKIVDIDYTSPSGEHTVLTYPLDHPGNFYLTLTVIKFPEQAD